MYIYLLNCGILWAMDMVLYVCRLCLKSFRSQGWAARHEETCIGEIQVVMLDGPQIRPEMARTVVEPEVR
jgi:hypothetical protein